MLSVLSNVQSYSSIELKWNTTSTSIMKTCLYNFDPLKHHIYKFKLGFRGVYIIFLISAQNIDFGFSLEPPRRCGSNKCPQSMFWVEIWKNIRGFYLKFFRFWRCNFLYIWIDVFLYWYLLICAPNKYLYLSAHPCSIISFRYVHEENLLIWICAVHSCPKVRFGRCSWNVAVCQPTIIPSDTFHTVTAPSLSINFMCETIWYNIKMIYSFLYFLFCMLYK